MFKNISKSVIILGIMFTLVLGLSYGTFIYTSDSYRATEMLVSNLSYGIDITASDATVSGKTVNVASGKTSTALLKVTSLNKIDTKYGVDYKITKGTGTVKYASNTGWLPTGKISENNVGTYEKVVKVVIAAETDMSVDFTVTGGFPNNELTEVASGYTRITEKAENIISYNDTLTTIIGKESSNNIYGGESTSNYLQYPINDDNTKNIWRILGNYSGIGTKIVSNQVSTTTKSTLSNDLTSFYNTLEKPDNYILTTDKFNCTNTSCSSSNYSKVGLISTSEYEMLGGINSYLASSESYFALDNGTVKNITSGGIEETSTTSGLRPAVYLQDYVTVTGSGTVSDPFKLKMPEYAVVLNVVHGSATLPSKMITRGENATYEITPNTGYKLVLSSNTCSNGTLEGNVFTISNVTSAQTCTVTLTPESYTLTLDPNGGNVSTTSKTVTYDSTYGDLPTPTRTGYTFNGWNGKNKFNSASAKQTLDNLTNTNGTYKQVTADTRTFLQWKLQKYSGDTYLGTLTSKNQDTGRIALTFTKDSSYDSIRFGLNGEKIDTIGRYDVSHLENGKTYTISANILNSTQGSISWNNIQIEEGDALTEYEPYYISSSTKVTTARNHTLTAGWTPNSLYTKLLADKTTRLTRTDFSTVLITDNTKTLYTSTENETTVYYFAGNATDNWVKFGGYYWRIIRTNHDGSIRLLYHGTSTTATDAYINSSTAFNLTYNDPMYVGYMYGTSGSLDSNRTNENSSTIKEVIDTWYQNNLNTNYGKYISTTSVYCSDRNLRSGSKYSTSSSSSFYYITFERTRDLYKPTYDCTDTSDKFTVDSSTGNGKLKYPIALMTADEISFAGGVYGNNAPTWYYYNSTNESSTGSTWWWILSPYYWSDNYASVFLVSGSSNPGYLNDYNVNKTNSVRPVTSLKSCVKWASGDGTADNPYTIQETTSGC